MKGKGLLLLRICNEMLKRTPKSSESAFCGRVLLFLSKAFPSAERFGINLRGDLNVENTTIIEPTIDDGPYSSKDIISSLIEKKPLKESFYNQFWRLQYFFLHPTDALLPDNWKILTSVMGIVVEIFEKITCTGTCIEQMSGSPFPKFMASKNLFPHQLVDLRFRQTFIIQSLIFVAHLQALSAKEQFRPPWMNVLPKNQSPLTQEHESWLLEIMRKTNYILSCMPEGRLSFRLVRWVLKNERNWVNIFFAYAFTLIIVSDEMEIGSMPFLRHDQSGFY